MSDLASLVRSGHTAPPFNGLFYATVATLIPVLFLAIAVQGRGYRKMLKAIVGTAGRHRLRGGGMGCVAAGANSRTAAAYPRGRHHVRRHR
jgi:hypothetical protein